MTQPLVAIHVRFSPDGGVTEISERPSSLSPQQWFNLLSNHAAKNYQFLSGGRGIFKVARAEVDSLQKGSVN
jgi:hypothetical protein